MSGWKVEHRTTLGDTAEMQFFIELRFWVSLPGQGYLCQSMSIECSDPWAGKGILLKLGRKIDSWGSVLPNSLLHYKVLVIMHPAPVSSSPTTCAVDVVD